MRAIVEINLFSGLPNPVWVLRDPDVREVLAVFEKLPVEAPGFLPNPSYAEPLGRPRAGYRGITVVIEDGDTSRTFEVFDDLVLDVPSARVRRDSGRQLEKQLYELIPKQIVDEFLEGMSYQQLTMAGSESTITNIEGLDVSVCATAPEYVGDTGDFNQFRFVNNCYNYATIVVNRVPLKAAIPGSPNVRRPLTMTKLRNALVDDLLIPVGMSLDGACLPIGQHYVAILLRRSPSGAVRDFHCLRLDRNGRWSHKDGKGEVRNVDDNGNPILDLGSAALSWDPELVGFYKYSAANRGRID